jgi:hypothetical protein
MAAKQTVDYCQFDGTPGSIPHNVSITGRFGKEPVYVGQCMPDVDSIQIGAEYGWK